MNVIEIIDFLFLLVIFTVHPFMAAVSYRADYYINNVSFCAPSLHTVIIAIPAIIALFVDINFVISIMYFVYAYTIGAKAIDKIKVRNLQAKEISKNVS